MDVPEDVHRVEVDHGVDDAADALEGSLLVPHLLADEIDRQDDDIEHQRLQDAPEELSELELLAFHAHAGHEAEEAVQEEHEENDENDVLERREVAEQDAEDRHQ